MIRIAVCDDNELQLEVSEAVLRNYLTTRSEEAEVEVFLSGKALIRAVREKGGFDIYILDMIMPGMNGIEVASLLRILKDEGKIIFLTSTVEYAVQSYDVDASAYLLKPVDQAKLARTLDKILSSFVKKDTSVILQTTEGAVRTEPGQILYVTLENRRLKYVLSDGRTFTSATIRRRFQEEVGDLLHYTSFSLCGLSLLVNLKGVDAVSSESLLMKNGDMLFPPASALPAFKQTWWQYKG